MDKRLLKLVTVPKSKDIVFIDLGHREEFACIRYARRVNNEHTGFVDVSVDSDMITFVDDTKNPMKCYSSTKSGNEEILKYVEDNLLKRILCDAEVIDCQFTELVQ